jgi:hypothetical protein
MTEMEDFQDRGEPYRQMFGIDGTAGDAQDERHPFVPDSPGGPCVVCGMAGPYRMHTEDWTTATVTNRQEEG